MKKLLLLIVLLLSLVGLVAAQNQTQTVTHDASAETCNRNLNGGFRNLPGYGSSGELRVKLYITPHYEMKDFQAVRKTYLDSLVEQMNQFAKDKGLKVRFEGADYYSSVEFNFLIFIDAYHDTNTDLYTFLFDVHGWGQHHLFNYVTPGSQASAAGALANGGATLPLYFEYGWTCKN